MRKRTLFLLALPIGATMWVGIFLIGTPRNTLGIIEIAEVQAPAPPVSKVSISPTDSCVNSKGTASILTPNQDSDTNLYIAHTMGLTQSGDAGTNTLEAFEYSYANGFRIFEADLLYTRDKHIIVAHDGHEHQWGARSSFATTRYRDIANNAYDGKYTALDLSALLVLLKAHPDAHVILDIKTEETAVYDEMLADITEQAVTILGKRAYRQLIPQIYFRTDIIRNPDICKFNDILFTQYRNQTAWAEVLDFLNKFPKISAVAVRYPERFEEDYKKETLEQGRGLYVHPVRDEATQDYFIRRDIGVFTVVSTTASHEVPAQ